MMQTKKIGKNLNKKSSGANTQNQRVGYCIIEYKDLIYLELKKGYYQLIGKKINFSDSVDEIIEKLIKSIFERTGFTIQKESFRKCSSRVYSDTLNGNVVSQECVVFRVSLEENLIYAPEKSVKIFSLSKKSFNKDFIPIDTPFKIKEISRKILRYNQ